MNNILHKMGKNISNLKCKSQRKLLFLWQMVHCADIIHLVQNMHYCVDSEYVLQYVVYGI